MFIHSESIKIAPKRATINLILMLHLDDQKLILCLVEDSRHSYSSINSISTTFRLLNCCCSTKWSFSWCKRSKNVIPVFTLLCSIFSLQLGWLFYIFCCLNLASFSIFAICVIFIVIWTVMMKRKSNKSAKNVTVCML